MCSSPTRCAPKPNCWASSLPLLSTVLSFQKHRAPHIITHIPQNTSSACIPGGRLPVCNSSAGLWAHAFQIELTQPGPGWAQIRGSLPLFRISAWMPTDSCVALGALYMQGHRESTHVWEIKIFHSPWHRDSSPGPGEMCEYVHRDTHKSIPSSNVLKSQHLETSQMPIKSRLDK